MSCHETRTTHNYSCYVSKLFFGGLFLSQREILKATGATVVEKWVIQACKEKYTLKRLLVYFTVEIRLFRRHWPNPFELGALYALLIFI